MRRIMDEVSKELEIMREALKNLSGSYGLGEVQVELKYGKGCNGWGIRGFKTFKQDMRNSLKRIEKYLGLNNVTKTKN